MSAEVNRPLRLFLALWPDEKIRKSIIDLTRPLRETARARWVRADNLHITLVFLGDVQEGQLNAIREIASEIKGTPFTLQLDRVEHWRRSGILSLVPTTTPDALTQLAENLSKRYRDLELSIDHRPYLAHLTLARNADCHGNAPLLPEPVIWHNHSFALVESRLTPEGSIYEELNRYQLVNTFDTIR
jgi:2'-5' RNA ligase